MHVRHIQRHEFDESERIKHIAFGRKLTTPKNDADDPDAIFTSVVVCCDESDAITARVRNIDYTCMIDGQQAFMTGLSGVASLPEARGLGRVRAILQYIFEEDYARGVHINAQFPFSHSYYRRYGYEIASERQVLRTPTNNLSTFGKARFGARMHNIEDGFDDIRLVTARMSERYNLGMRLNDRQYKKIFGGDALHHGDYRYILYDTGGAPIAYLYYVDREDADGTCTAAVQVLEFVDEAALLCALGFLYSLRARYAFIECPLPGDVRILRLLDEPKDATVRLIPYGMARLVNAKATLALMRHPQGSGRYAVAVKDDMLSPNNATFVVSYEDGAARVERVEANDADMHCTIGALTQLVLGYADIGQAALWPGVSLTSNRETLARVFTKRPTLLSHYF
jgi:predicted acetyltransferase